MNSHLGHLPFGADPIFGTLTVALPNLSPDFSGDLLSLVVLDVLASTCEAPVRLGPAWEKLLNADEIASFIVTCGRGYQTESREILLSVISSLESMAAASLKRHHDLGSRSSLLAVLQDMYARLGEDEEEELLAGEIYGTSPHAPDPDYESEAYYEHEEMLAHDNYRICWEERVERAQGKRDTRKHDRDIRRKIIQLSLETATDGPAPHFRIDLCRKAMILTNSGELQVDAFTAHSSNMEIAEAAKGKKRMLPEGLCSERTASKEPESILEVGEGHVTADPQGLISNSCALGDVQLGTLSSPDGSERWEDSEDDGFYRGDDSPESPKDYAACSLDDCGYCGHCPY